VKLEQSFEVHAPLERVWETLIDVERVAPCLPGAEVTHCEGDTYEGTFSVRLGPTTAAYRGELKMQELDEASHSVTMYATGRDKRGQGSAKATIVSTMREEGDVTQVEVETDLTITGRLARFGRGGMIEDISNRLMKEFSDCLQQRIEAPPAAEPGLIDAVLAATPEGAAVAPPAAGGSKSGTTTKPLGGFSLFFRSLLDRLRRLFRRG
jgi:carbon monoxide dehydrogenase subunit G